MKTLDKFDAEEFSIIRKRLEDQLKTETCKPPTVIRGSLAVDAVVAELATERSKSPIAGSTILTFERESEVAKGELTAMEGEEDRLRGELDLASFNNAKVMSELAEADEEIGRRLLLL